MRYRLRHKGFLGGCQLYFYVFQLAFVVISARYWNREACERSPSCEERPKLDVKQLKCLSEGKVKNIIESPWRRYPRFEINYLIVSKLFESCIFYSGILIAPQGPTHQVGTT